eukprot:1150369-Pelagomonas_calceolata.AAC.1
MQYKAQAMCAAEPVSPWAMHFNGIQQTAGASPRAANFTEATLTVLQHTRCISSGTLTCPLSQTAARLADGPPDGHRVSTEGRGSIEVTFTIPQHQMHQRRHTHLPHSHRQLSAWQMGPPLMATGVRTVGRGCIEVTLKNLQHTRCISGGTLTCLTLTDS